jgi:hypothetical protein
MTLPEHPGTVEHLPLDPLLAVGLKVERLER